MALLDSKQLNPKLTGSFILSGSTQTFIGRSDFQGSITASGDISASGVIIADTFQSTGGDVDGISFTDDLNLSGNLTASGDISGSGNIFGTGNLDIDGTSNLQGNATLQGDIDVDGTTNLDNTDIDGTLTVDGTNTTITSTIVSLVGAVTASSNISASGNLSATGNLDIDGTSNLASDLYVGGNITGSNDISGSYIGTGSFGKLSLQGNLQGPVNNNLDIKSDKDIRLYLDEDDDGSFHKFQVFNEDGDVKFAVASDGKSSIGAAVTSNSLDGLSVTGGITATGHITASGDISASGNIYGTGNLDIDGTSNFAGNVTMQNDLVVTGRLDAEEIHTTFISSSITQATGSNIFGDSVGDSHQFTGSLDISGSGTALKVSDGNVVVSDTLTATNIGAFTSTGAIDFDNQNMTNVDIDSGNIDAVTFGSTAQSMISGSRDAASISGSVAEPSGNVSGSYTSTGSFGKIETGGDISVAGSIRHAGDNNTRILFTDDDININVGGVNMIDFTEDDSQDEVTINESGADLDFRVESQNDTKAIYLDASQNSIQLGTAATTHVTASGDISGSYIGTGSFGRLEIAGDADINGDITIGGGITLGDSAGDSVSFGAEISSSLIPDADSTYDIGSSSKNWRFGYIEQLSSTHITASGNFTGSSASSGSFGYLTVDGIDVSSLGTTDLSAFSSSIAEQLNTLSADVIALSIALG